jgi:hypothetical protein
MGTAQVVFAEDREEVRTIAHDRKCRDRKRRLSHGRKWRHSRALSGSMFCACATGSCAISALVGPFWSEVTKSRDRKRLCPEAIPTGSMFSAFPLFTPCVFFLSSSNMANGCDLRSLDSFGVPLGVRIRNRKLRNTRSDRRSHDPFGSVLGCSLRRPRLITIGNPASYI